jgi:ribosomal subunit interface protein
MAHSDALAAHVLRRSEKLEHFFDRIISCHVVVELMGHRHHGSRYRVSINVGLPGRELLVSHTPSEERNTENAHAIADRAFDEAERQLEDWVRRQREDRHAEARRAT